MPNDTSSVAEVSFDNMMKYLNHETAEISLRAVNDMFQKWLKRNAKRFPFNVNVLSGKSVVHRFSPRWAVAYGFEGLAKELYFTVASDGLQVYLDLGSTSQTLICEFDVFPAMQSGGKYICSKCLWLHGDEKINPARNLTLIQKTVKIKEYRTLAGLYAIIVLNISFHGPRRF